MFMFFNHIAMSRKSKSRTNEPTTPIVGELGTELVHIREYARKYANLDKMMKGLIDNYVPMNKSIDFYHGMYVSMQQSFLMSHQSQNPIADAFGAMICVISYRIVELEKLGELNQKNLFKGTLQMPTQDDGASSSSSSDSDS